MLLPQQLSALDTFDKAKKEMDRKINSNKIQ